MSLADHLTSPPTQCKTCVWYAELPVSEREFFDQHVAARGSLRALHRAATAEGLQVVRSCFMDHLREHHEGAR